MTEATAEALYLAGSKGPDLTAALDLVADCEALGQRKFTPRISRQLMRMILCRNHAGAVLELCHLVVLAEATGRRAGCYEDFFWGSGPARPESFRGFLSKEIGTHKRVGQSIAIEQRQAVIHYPDGSFTIAFGRMPLLSALMEFLMTALGYDVMETLLQPLLTSGSSRARNSDTANRICKQAYDYLNRELGSLHNHRTFGTLIAFLRQRQDGDFGSQDIDDDAVMAYWYSSPCDGGKAPRTFVSVYRNFLRLRQALEAGADAHALGDARTIGPNREGGEVDPDAVMGRVEAIAQESAPLQVLAAPPAASVKFLTKAETAALKLLADSGRLAVAFRLSLLRAEVFGAQQARLTQARRRGLAGDDLRQTIGAPTRLDYDGQRAAYERLAEQLQKLLLASLYALVTAQRIEGIGLILAFRPQADLSHLRRSPLDAESKLVSLDATKLARQLLRAIAAGQPSSPDIAALMREARRAFRSISRRGFDEASIASGELDDAFAEGVGALQPLAQRLAAFCEAISQPPASHGSWSRLFDDDADAFRVVFSRIYGVTP